MPRIRPVGFVSASPGSPFTCGMTAIPRLEAGQAERELGEDDRRDADHDEDVAVFLGQGGRPVGDDVALGGHVPQAGHHDDRVEREVDADQGDGDADRLQEALEEHRAEQRDQYQGDDHLLVVEGRFQVRVLHEVGGGVGGGQGDGDEEVGGREAEQGEDEELALPEGQQPRQHRDRALAVRTLLCHPPVDRQRARQRHDHQHDRRDGGEEAGHERGDAGPVAEGGEVVLRPGATARRWRGGAEVDLGPDTALVPQREAPGGVRRPDDRHEPVGAHGPGVPQAPHRQPRRPGLAGPSGVVQHVGGGPGEGGRWLRAADAGTTSGTHPVDGYAPFTRRPAALTCR